MRVQSRAFKAGRAEFRDKCRDNNRPCWICGQPIDYDARHDDYANDSRFQLDHRYPVSTHPEIQEDPANWEPSHAGCNRERSNRPPRPNLGTLSQAWV